jgi:hypothetical protein
VKRKLPVAVVKQRAALAAAQAAAAQAAAEKAALATNAVKKLSGKPGAGSASALPPAIAAGPDSAAALTTATDANANPSVAPTSPQPSSSSSSSSFSLLADVWPWIHVMAVLASGLALASQRFVGHLSSLSP